MLYKLKKKAIGTSHSKIILIGEHAVVYGKPAIALPFPTLNVTTIIEETGEPVHVKTAFYTGPLHKVPEKMKGIVVCMKEAVKELGEKLTGFSVKIHSNIPLGRGLGSSAAIAISIVRALFRYFGKELPRETLMRLVHIAETYAHGNPSGIDMEAASSANPIWFQKGKETETVKLGATFYLIVADTGQIGDTKAAVESIRNKYEEAPEKTESSLQLLEEYTYQVRDALLNGDIPLVGTLLNLAQEELAKLGVSNETIEHLVIEARKAGAYGAKLTGGGRGGCIIALTDTLQKAKELSQILLQKGAHNTWYVRVSENFGALAL